VTDEHPGSSDDTTPLSAPDGDSWLPAREQSPPHQWVPPGPPPAYGPTGPGTGPGTPYAGPLDAGRPAYLPPGTQPYPVQHRPPEPTRGRVPGWLWPVVSGLALVIGVIGGVVGGAVYENLHSSATEGQVSGGLGAAGVESRAPLPEGNHSVASVARRLLPSTIQVLAQYQGKKDGATGSGFVLDRSGHFITNNHVVADAVAHDGPIEIVDQNGDKYDATVVGRSPTYDLAVLYVKSGPRLPPASLGSARVLNVGDPVVAFGSPLGLSSTVTAGIVSALNRPVTTSDTGSDSSYINAVQTDAAINPGNSGGPLVNLQGQVIGVNSAIASLGSSVSSDEGGNIGVGFAIPIEQVQVTTDQILRTGKAQYPVIGANVQGTAKLDGARVDSIASGSPASKSDLEVGDVIVTVDGKPVTGSIDVVVAVRAHQPGEKVTLTVRRDGKEMQIVVGQQAKNG
jgi:putative serine protease PepD